MIFNSVQSKNCWHKKKARRDDKPFIFIVSNTIGA
jgi:hypothetical protein